MRRESEVGGRRALALPEPFTGKGGTLPGVDITDSAALLDLMEHDLPVEKRR